MVKIMSTCLTRGKVAKIILLVLVLFILILTILPQNVLAEENNQVNASEILGNISRGEPVKVYDSIIIGNLDVSGIRDNLAEIEIEGIEKRIVKSPILIVDSTIQGNVDFNLIFFNDTVKFGNVTFNKTADFQKSTFKEEADFLHANFNEGASFTSVKFNDAEFKDATFNNYADFSSATFDDDAIFCNALFVEKAFFDCIFNDRTVFSNATFNNSADFSWATFNGVVSFRGVTFNDYATFRYATFNNAEADFGFAKFMQTANFNHTKFNDEANFQNARFNDTAYFSLAKFKDRAYFTDASFNDTVDFSDADIFRTMKIRWSQLEGKLVYNDYFYQSLIRNFETLGLSNDTNEAYYKYKVEKRRHINIKSPLGFIRRPLEFIFLDRFCGYGVKPLRAIIWAGIIIGSFSGLYWLIEEEDRGKRLWAFVKERWNKIWVFVDRRIKGKENKKSKSDSSLKDRLKRLWAFFKDRGKKSLKFLFLSVSIFTTLGKWKYKNTENNWKPAKNYETGFRILAMVEVFLGWIIMTLFVISLTMTWIR